MKKLHFENTDEFERVFKAKDEEVTDAMVEGINEAFSFQKKSAELFEITFQDIDIVYEITLPSTQWEIALETCLNHYRDLEQSDKAIDVYLLQKGIRQWLS
jgi:capsule polysaccharide export protein KpsC/LpsZ